MRYTQRYLGSLTDEMLLALQHETGRLLDEACDTHSPAATYRRRYWRIMEEREKRTAGRAALALAKGE